jgi:hypothetical protein
MLQNWRAHGNLASTPFFLYRERFSRLQMAEV